MKITTVLPVSRIKYLDRVLESLKKQTVQPQNLIVVWDGHDEEYLQVRNKISALEYETLCVTSTNLSPAFTIPDRRRHIVNVHNQMRELVEDCDWIFSIEDDGILPEDALEKLLDKSRIYIDVGMITGVELGRHDNRYVGAWKVDNVFEPTKIESLSFTDEGVQELDGCGLYCALIRPDLYKSHEFYTKNGLGPDVNLGLHIKQQGYKNYIDWSIHITHLGNIFGEEVEIKASDKSHVVKMFLLSGSTWGH